MEPERSSAPPMRAPLCHDVPRGEGRGVPEGPSGVDIGGGRGSREGDWLLHSCQRFEDQNESTAVLHRRSPPESFLIIVTPRNNYALRARVQQERNVRIMQ